jgi:hypothetical protein
MPCFSFEKLKANPLQHKANANKAIPINIAIKV